MQSPSVQYPKLVEPVLVEAAPESITIDKWFAETRQPQFKKAAVRQHPNGIVGVSITSATAPPPLPFQSGPTVIAANFSWQDQSKAAPTPEPSLFFPTTLDQWFAPTQQPQLAGRENPLLSGVFLAEPSDLDPAESITLDKWYVEPPRPRFDRKGVRPNPSGIVVVSVTSSTATPPLPFQSGPAVIAADYSWQYQSKAQPITFDEDQELLTLDKWYVRAGEPVRTRPKVTHTPSVAITEPSLFVTQALAWIRPIEVPTLPRVRPAWNYQNPITEPTLIVQQNVCWIQPLSLPVLPKVRTAHTLYVAPQTETIPAPGVPDFFSTSPAVYFPRKPSMGLWAPSHMYVQWDSTLLPDTPSTVGSVTAYAMMEYTASGSVQLEYSVTARAELLASVG
jgi:hypothetical protein